MLGMGPKHKCLCCEGQTSAAFRPLLVHGDTATEQVDHVAEGLWLHLYAEGCQAGRWEEGVLSPK